VEEMHAQGAANPLATEPEEGDTPLGVACRFGHVEVAKWLVTHGANPTATNHAGEGPLHDACLHGSVAMIEWLLTLPEVGGASGSETATSSDVPINQPTAQGMTPIAFAALQGHTDAVRALAAKGADVSVVDAEGHTLIHLACSKGHVATATSLRELGVPVAARDAAGRTAMHLACGEGQLAAARWLREEAKLPVDEPDSGGARPLHFACAAGDEAKHLNGAEEALDGRVHRHLVVARALEQVKGGGG